MFESVKRIWKSVTGSARTILLGSGITLAEKAGDGSKAQAQSILTDAEKSVAKKVSKAALAKKSNLPSPLSAGADVKFISIILMPSLMSFVCATILIRRYRRARQPIPVREVKITVDRN